MRVGLGAKGGGDDSGKSHRGETSGGGSGCQWDGGILYLARKDYTEPKQAAKQPREHCRRSARALAVGEGVLRWGLTR
jgi:hypothetical protein